MKLTRSVRRRSLVILALGVIFTITGFFILPPIIKAQLEKRLSSELGRRVTVGKVRLNPYVLSVTLENLAIQEKDGAALFLGWRRLYVNFDALSSLRGEWVLSDVALDGFDAHGILNRDQSLNVSDLLAKFAPPATAATTTAKAPSTSTRPRPVRVEHLRISEAKVEWVDRSRPQPFVTTLGPLTFDLAEFRTAGERDAPYRFEAVTEAGERLAWSGTLRADPFQSAGKLSVENILLAKYAPYYADRMQADITAGRLSVRGRYELDLAEGHRAANLQDGVVELRGFSMRERGAERASVELPSVDISGVSVDALTQKASIGSIALAGGHIRAQREKDGSINLLTMLQPPTGVATSTPGPPASVPRPATQTKPPDVALADFALKDFTVEFTDSAAATPARLALSALQVSLKKFTLAAGARMPLQLAFDWAPRGTVRLGGDIGLTPVVADLKIDVADLEILPLSPYLEQFVSARLSQATVTATLATQVAMVEGKPLAATATGDVQVEKLGLVDSAHNEELAGFGALTLRGLQASTAPNIAITLDEIAIAGPYARVVVNADKSLNFAAVAKPAATPPSAALPAASPGSTTTPPPNVKISKVTISDGDFRFTDRSVEPNVSMAINQFGGTITGLASANPTKADVDLKTAVDGAGPVSITGKLDPLGANKLVDLKVDFKNVDLLPLSAYSGKYAGYELARGKLALDVKLLVDGKKIDASNVITLNQFTFGPPVNSPEATSLPVRLGVALLKDMDGKIVIDVPVQGSTDDPNFRVGRVVLRVIVNLLTKAAVSPFSLIGAAFGGGGEELAFQEFAPGSADIQPAEIKKLDTMVQALTNRPGLSLGVEGSYDTAADSYALKRLKLAGQIRRTIWETKRLADPNIPPPDQLVVAPEENAAAIKKLFDEKFPPGTEFGTPLPPPPAVVAPPPPPPASFFKRVARVITFQAKREQHAAQQESARLAAEHDQAVAAALTTGLPVEQMTGRLAEATAIDDNDLRTLAQARARQVRDYFVTTGKIAGDRLFLSNASATANTEPAKAGKGPRVFLQLQ